MARLHSLALVGFCLLLGAYQARPIQRPRGSSLLPVLSDVALCHQSRAGGSMARDHFLNSFASPRVLT